MTKWPTINFFVACPQSRADHLMRCELIPVCRCFDVAAACPRGRTCSHDVTTRRRLRRLLLMSTIWSRCLENTGVETGKIWPRRDSTKRRGVWAKRHVGDDWLCGFEAVSSSRLAAPRRQFQPALTCNIGGNCQPSKLIIVYCVLCICF